MLCYSGIATGSKCEVSFSAPRESSGGELDSLTRLSAQEQKPTVSLLVSSFPFGVLSNSFYAKSFPLGLLKMICIALFANSHFQKGYCRPVHDRSATRAYFYGLLLCSNELSYFVV